MIEINNGDISLKYLSIYLKARSGRGHIFLCERLQMSLTR